MTGTIHDWSATAASNTTCEGIGCNTGMSPGNVDNVFRAIMAVCKNTISSTLTNFLAGSAGLGVANGGTGATTLTGFLKGNGTGAVTAVATSGGTVKFLRDDATMAAPLEAIVIAVTADDVAVAAGTARFTFRMPYAFTVVGLPRASLVTAQTSGSLVTVDINDSGTTILSTKLTLDNTEKTSTTAATPCVVSDSALADDAIITIDVDGIGDGTAKGLKVTLIGRQA